MSRWVDLFLLHCNHINKPYIQNCLVSILHNNPVSILATIDDHKILTLIKCFFEEAAQLLPLQNNLSTTSLANNPPNMSSASNPLNMPSTNPNKSLPTKYLPTKYLPTKYLRLFSTFIKCEDSILKANQLIILH